MSLWTLFKIFAGICVLGVMAVTGMLAYHVLVRPLGGKFEEFIPNPGDLVGRKQPDAEFAKMLDSSELPDIDPGEKAFQKAHELLAMGKLEEAREKLTSIVNVFPSSSSAPMARRIVGDMNLDEILSTAHMEGKQTHVVKRGDSFLRIAGQYRTTLEMIMHLNGMMELKGIQPGEELVVMPLDFRLLIEPQRKSVSIWQEGKFIREYPILHLGVSGTLPKGKTKIGSKTAELNGKNVAPESKYYRAADKIVQISKPSVQIRGMVEDEDEDDRRGIILRGEDMEEISLLTRVGNEVEIR